jgi:hypothetical protein
MEMLLQQLNESKLQNMTLKEQHKRQLQEKQVTLHTLLPVPSIHISSFTG